MQFRENRLETYEGAFQSKSKQKRYWTHDKPSPEVLADYGFFFTPTKLNLDQITCCSCKKKETNVGGVENMAQHHLQSNPNCALSKIISQQISHLSSDLTLEEYWKENPDEIIRDVNCKAAVDMRKKTFGLNWKFDKSKGSKATSLSLAKSGFYYCPLRYGNDRVQCVYCSCSLDTWLSNDDPIEEHRANAPGYCYFLEKYNAEPKPKKKRAAKSNKLEVSHSKEDTVNESTRDITVDRTALKEESLRNEINEMKSMLEKEDIELGGLEDTVETGEGVRKEEPEVDEDEEIRPPVRRLRNRKVISSQSQEDHIPEDIQIVESNQLSISEEDGDSSQSEDDSDVLDYAFSNPDVDAPYKEKEKDIEEDKNDSSTASGRITRSKQPKTQDNAKRINIDSSDDEFWDTIPGEDIDLKETSNNSEDRGLEPATEPIKKTTRSTNVTKKKSDNSKEQKSKPTKNDKEPSEGVSGKIEQEPKESKSLKEKDTTVESTSISLIISSDEDSEVNEVSSSSFEVTEDFFSDEDDLIEFTSMKTRNNLNKVPARPKRIVSNQKLKSAETSLKKTPSVEPEHLLKPKQKPVLHNNISFDDERFEQILKSPKKLSKRINMKQADSPSPTSIHDISNHNLGDYEEDKLDFLEQNIKLHAPKSKSPEESNSKLSKKEKLPDSLSHILKPTNLTKLPGPVPISPIKKIPQKKQKQPVVKNLLDFSSVFDVGDGEFDVNAVIQKAKLGEDASRPKKLEEEPVFDIAEGESIRNEDILDELDDNIKKVDTIEEIKESTPIETGVPEEAVLHRDELEMEAKDISEDLHVEEHDKKESDVRDLDQSAEQDISQRHETTHLQIQTPARQEIVRIEDEKTVQNNSQKLEDKKKENMEGTKEDDMGMLIDEKQENEKEITEEIKELSVESSTPQSKQVESVLNIDVKSTIQNPDDNDKENKDESTKGGTRTWKAEVLADAPKIFRENTLTTATPIKEIRPIPFASSNSNKSVDFSKSNLETPSKRSLINSAKPRHIGHSSRLKSSPSNFPETSPLGQNSQSSRLSESSTTSKRSRDDLATHDIQEETSKKIKVEKLNIADVIESSTPQRQFTLKISNTSSRNSIKLSTGWKEASFARLLDNLSNMETTSDYLHSLSNSQYELNDDYDGELTSFISNMPEDEEEMTLQQWIRSNAGNCRKLLEQVCFEMIASYRKECDRAIRVLEEMPEAEE